MFVSHTHPLPHCTIWTHTFSHRFSTKRTGTHTNAHTHTHTEHKSQVWISLKREELHVWVIQISPHPSPVYLLHVTRAVFRSLPCSVYAARQVKTECQQRSIAQNTTMTKKSTEVIWRYWKCEWRGNKSQGKMFSSFALTNGGGWGDLLTTSVEGFCSSQTKYVFEKEKERKKESSTIQGMEGVSVTVHPKTGTQADSTLWKPLHSQKSSEVCLTQNNSSWFHLILPKCLEALKNTPNLLSRWSVNLSGRRTQLKDLLRFICIWMHHQGN